jgi:hypothetical protein
MNEVLECLTISGEFDFMLKVVAPTWMNITLSCKQAEQH